MGVKREGGHSLVGVKKGEGGTSMGAPKAGLNASTIACAPSVRPSIARGPPFVRRSTCRVPRGNVRSGREGAQRRELIRCNSATTPALQHAPRPAPPPVSAWGLPNWREEREGRGRGGQGEVRGGGLWPQPRAVVRPARGRGGLGAHDRQDGSYARGGEGEGCCALCVVCVGCSGQGGVRWAC